MRATLEDCDSAASLHERYAQAEGSMFQELHQILLLDTGTACIRERIERMNAKFAPLQRLTGPPLKGEGPEATL